MKALRPVLVQLLVASFSIIALVACGGAPSVLPTGPVPTVQPVLPHLVTWPISGEAGIRVNGYRPDVEPGERIVPIASVAKIMTAYLVLEKLPLHGADPGPSITLTATDVVDYRRRRADDQSVVAVRAGEVLTERAALEELMLPSANNVAVVLAREVSGSVAAFVSLMNHEARVLGMRATTYTDPSGYEASTRSTAADQLRLAQVATGSATLMDIVGMRSAIVPVAGRVVNTDTVLGERGIIGLKTGSDDAAGGCFVFDAHFTFRGRRGTVVGVVLGQHGGDLVQAALAQTLLLVTQVESEL